MSSRIGKGMLKPHPAYPTTMDGTMSRIIETWKQHAGTYLRRDDTDRIAILFDTWVADPGYRREIGRRLEVEIEDETLNAISRFGGGSSFDGLDYDGRASEMAVSRRALLLGPKERALLERTTADEEIQELNAEVKASDPAGLI